MDKGWAANIKKRVQVHYYKMVHKHCSFPNLMEIIDVTMGASPSRVCHLGLVQAQLPQKMSRRSLDANVIQLAEPVFGFPNKLYFMATDLSAALDRMTCTGPRSPEGHSGELAL